jgi:hypothetical protein
MKERFSVKIEKSEGSYFLYIVDKQKGKQLIYTLPLSLDEIEEIQDIAELSTNIVEQRITD